MPTKRTVPSWLSKAPSSPKARALKHGYRSGLEEKLAAQLQALGVPVLFETFKLDYVIPENWHKYTPDLRLPNQIIIEGKGIFDAQDRAKHLFIKAQYPELDIRFVFSRSAAPITKGSKTTLADWCRKFGYKFSDKLIPEAWLHESGPTKTIEEVLKAGPFGFVKSAKR